MKREEKRKIVQVLRVAEYLLQDLKKRNFNEQDKNLLIDECVEIISNVKYCIFLDMLEKELKQIKPIGEVK